MEHRIVRVILIALLFLASASAVEIVSDPIGDVILGSYDNNVPSVYPWPAVDLTAISMGEDADNFYWTVTIAGPPAPGNGNCADSGDLRTFFRYGEARYHVQQGLDLNCNPYGMFWETYGGDFSRRFIATLDVEIVDNDITVTIPKLLVLDEGGAPPIEGRWLTHVRGRSFNMASLGGPDITDPFGGGEGDLLVVNDDIPDNVEDAGSYQIMSGGTFYGGDIRLLSERPFRASNGGEGVYIYAMTLENRGAASTFDLALLNTPDQWRIAGPTSFELDADETFEFQLGIEVPFRHQHGGTDAVTVRVTNDESWAEMDIGISYLTVPQPAGHHPEVYLHLSGPGGFAPFGGGGTFTMNTTIPEFTRPVSGASDDGPTGSTMTWHVCLEGDLKLGLNFTKELGALTASLSSQQPVTGAFSGKLMHLGAGVPLQFCHPSAFGSRITTDLATIDAVDVSVSAQTPVITTITPLATLIPYEAGSTLYVALDFAHDSANIATLGQTVITEGAKLILPLGEYREGTIIGAIGEEEPAALADVEPQADEESEDTPWAMPIVGLLAVAFWRRR